MPAWVDIDLDSIRKLRYQHNDIADMEQHTGKSFKELLTVTQFNGVRTLLAYGLRWMDQKMTPTKAGALIQEYWIEKGKTLDDLSDVLTEALEVGGIIPKPKGPAEGNASPEAAH